MRMFKNIMWMLSGVGVGMVATTYSKDVQKFIKKSGKEMTKMTKNNQNN